MMLNYSAPECTLHIRFVDDKCFFLYRLLDLFYYFGSFFRTLICDIIGNNYLENLLTLDSKDLVID